MINQQLSFNFNEYYSLYEEVVSDNHFLRRLHDDVDFDQITKVLLPKYSATMGRTAYSPTYMFKLCLLKVMTDLSDVDLIEEVRVNMAYKFFLDINPNDVPCDATTLCKFRRQRIGDKNFLDTLLAMTLEFAEQKGIKKRIDGKFIVQGIIDATHTESEFNCYRPVPALKGFARKLRSALYGIDEDLTETLKKDKNIQSTDLQGQIKYSLELLAFVKENYSSYLIEGRVKKAYNRLKEAVEDIRTYYSGDPDAGLGHKSADTSFFGYKHTVLMDKRSGLIMAAFTTSGEVGDAIPGQKVLQGILKNKNIKLTEVIGDTAYSGQPFLEMARDNDFEILTTPHPNLGTGIDGRDGFTFNKDADMFICPNGHLAISKRIVTYKRDNSKRAIYRFDPNLCATCPLKETCLRNAKEKTFSVSILSTEHQKLLQNNQDPEYRRRRKERYKIERLNAHLKGRYAFRKAQCIGISMMTHQAAIAMFLYNMQKIYTLTDKK